MNLLHHPGSPKAPCGSPGISSRGGSRTPRLSSPCIAPPARRAFTLTELLVVIAIILSLMTMLGGAVSNVRTTQKANATRDTIMKINTALLGIFEQFGDEAVPVPAPANRPADMTASAYRAWVIRRSIITANMPDRWTDVEYMAANPALFSPLSQAQRNYINIWNSLGASLKANNSSAECLFMVVMLSGLSNCLGCENLNNLPIGDEDKDGIPEFNDAWGNPIGYLLWAPGLELPAGSGTKFFSDSRQVEPPFPDVKTTVPVSPALGLRPLIYSGGPDGKHGFERHAEAVSFLFGGVSKDGDLGRDIGNAYPLATPPCRAGGKDDSTVDYRADNVTNFDVEIKQ
jgi:prepilin-type N-terminal cleavage/methylation domain-containing protein